MYLFKYYEIYFLACWYIYNFLLEKSICLSSVVFFQIFSGSSIGLFKSASFKIFLPNKGLLLEELPLNVAAAIGSVGFYIRILIYNTYIYISIKY